MIASFVLSEDQDRNTRLLNNWFREVGLAGKSIEVTLDGEGQLRRLFERASKSEGTPITGVGFMPTPPGRHQSNGKVGANLLFLEERLLQRIPFHVELMTHLVPYVVRTHNIHHVPQGSTSSALDRMKGRQGAKRPVTFPFGCKVLARPTPRSKEDRQADSASLEALTEVVYLGPWTSTGGGLVGMLMEKTRFDVPGADQGKTRRCQVAKIISPCEWSLKDLEPLLSLGEGEGLGPREPLKESPDSEFEELVEVSNEPLIQIPPGGPPLKWVTRNGPLAAMLVSRLLGKERVTDVFTQRPVRKDTQIGWRSKKPSVLPPPVHFQLKKLLLGR